MLQSGSVSQFLKYSCASFHYFYTFLLLKRAMLRTWKVKLICRTVIMMEAVLCLEDNQRKYMKKNQYLILHLEVAMSYAQLSNTNDFRLAQFFKFWVKHREQNWNMLEEQYWFAKLSIIPVLDQLRLLNKQDFLWVLADLPLEVLRGIHNFCFVTV